MRGPYERLPGRSVDLAKLPPPAGVCACDPVEVAVRERKVDELRDGAAAEIDDLRVERAEQTPSDRAHLVLDFGAGGPVALHANEDRVRRGWLNVVGGTPFRGRAREGGVGWGNA